VLDCGPGSPCFQAETARTPGETRRKPVFRRRPRTCQRRKLRSSLRHHAGPTLQGASVVLELRKVVRVAAHTAPLWRSMLREAASRLSKHAMASRSAPEGLIPALHSLFAVRHDICPTGNELVPRQTKVSLSRSQPCGRARGWRRQEAAVSPTAES
jgi:hypothetical protein